MEPEKFVPSQEVTVEMMKPKFTYADRTRMRKDWASVLSDMHFIPKTSHIAFRRMIGPLLMSVSLQLDQRLVAKYSVMYYIHNLAVNEDFLTASIHTGPDLKYITIDFCNHKFYPEIAASIKQKAWIPIDGPITLDDIFNGYAAAAKVAVPKRKEKYDQFLAALTKRFDGDAAKAKEHLDRGGLTFNEACVPALAAAWAGEPEKAKEYLEWGSKVCGLYEADKFRSKYEKMIQDPEALRQTVIAERSKHQVEYAPYQDIVGVSYKEKAFT